MKFDNWYLNVGRPRHTIVKQGASFENVFHSLVESNQLHFLPTIFQRNMRNGHRLIGISRMAGSRQNSIGYTDMGTQTNDQGFWPLFTHTYRSSSILKSTTAWKKGGCFRQLQIPIPLLRSLFKLSEDNVLTDRVFIFAWISK